jgi:hypothetical protein
MVILTIIGIIFTWMSYRWVCRMATRSVASTEQTGELMQALIDALPPEAQARAAEAAARRRAEREAALATQRKNRRIAVAGFVVVLIMLGLASGRSGSSNSTSGSSNSTSSLTGTRTAEYQTLCGPNPVRWSVDASGREIYSCDGKAWWRK